MRISPVVVMLFVASHARAEDRFFAGAVFGVATISADARFGTPQQPVASGYKPENGPAASPFFGAHLSDYISVQIGYTWNRNDVRYLMLQGAVLSEQPAQTTHRLALADAMLYFRRRSSWVRPYLTGGGGLAWVSSVPASPAPQFDFTDHKPVVNVTVGVDIRLRAGWRFRYSFAETIQHNALSRHVSPPAVRNLAQFRNFFGFLKEF